MGYAYDDIVREFFEELKPLFVNYLHKNFNLDYDEIMDIYSEVWIDVRRNILCGRVEPDTKWKAYILKMGWNRASNLASRRRRDHDSLDDVYFNRDEFEKRYAEEKAAEVSIYSDSELQTVLAAELGSIPEPCNKLLKMFYFEGLTMGEIADTMNYSNARTAITTKRRCMEKLRARVVNTARWIGIID